MLPNICEVKSRVKYNFVDNVVVTESNLCNPKFEIQNSTWTPLIPDPIQVNLDFYR